MAPMTSNTSTLGVDGNATSSKAAALVYGEDTSTAPDFVDWFTFFSLFSNVSHPSTSRTRPGCGKSFASLFALSWQDRGVKLRINIADTILLCPKGGTCTIDAALCLLQSRAPVDPP